MREAAERAKGALSAIRVTLAVDNHAAEGLRFEHGLSFFIETDEAVSHVSAFTLSTSALEVLPGVILSGEIQARREIAIDSRFQTGRDELRQDTFDDEQCVIVRSGDGTAVLVGCAHRGLENNVLAAMDVAGVKRLDLVAGGFHLNDAGEDRLRYLADFLQDTDIGEISCCHCTGEGAYEYLRSRLGSRVTLAQAGKHWEL